MKTYIDKSNIHGLGVFASEPICRGTIIWQEGYEHVYSPDVFDQLPLEIQNIILERGWKDNLDGLYRLSVDNDQFINHSDQSNTKTLEGGTIIASRDINIGEEITNNYHEFDERVVDKKIS